MPEGELKDAWIRTRAVRSVSLLGDALREVLQEGVGEAN